MLSPTRKQSLLRLLGSSLAFASSFATLHAGDDWAQWRGPNRDGHAAEQSLLKKWPENGPKPAWSFGNAGIGYSSVSVEGKFLYTMGKRDNENQLICLDVKTGKEKWKSSLGPASTGKEYLSGWGDGPRCSPTIEGDFVYALCDLGVLGCFKKSDGAKVWTVNLVSDFGGTIPKWGYSESVLIDGDRVIVTPGGKNFLVGLDKKTGKKNWETSFSAGAQYVSVIKHVFQDVPVYLTACDQGLVGIHATTGELLFKNGSTGNGVAVIPTPIVSGDIVYHSSAYKAGNAAVKISVSNGKLSAKELYHEAKESMENHHGGYIVHDGAIFGFSKALRGVWMAQDIETGKVLWSKKVGKATSGSIAFADGLLYCYDDQEGVCYLAKASREGWEELGKVALPEQTASDRKQGAIWAHPVIAGQKLFIRDQEKIFAFDIAAGR
jgi:outer membrane protein assembly factor BamB